MPANYDQLMVPLLFRPMRRSLRAAPRGFAPRRILETAAGTGVVTEALAEALPDAEIVATDLNQPMLDVAAQRVTSDKVSFVAADAQELPFDDGSFDLVVCQFGAMFFPDRVRGHSEARRVLGDGGRYLLAIWDRIERNPLSDTSQQTLDRPVSRRSAAVHARRPVQLSRSDGDRGAIFAPRASARLRSRPSSCRAAAPRRSDAATRALLRHADGRRDAGPRAGQPRAGVRDVERAASACSKEPTGIDAPMSAHIVTATK